MAAPAQIAKKNAKALEAIEAAIQEVKTDLLQLDGALAKRLEAIEAAVAALAPKPASAPKAK